LKLISFISFFLFAFVLVSGTNNVIILFSHVSQSASDNDVASNLKKALNSMMEEECNDEDSEEETNFNAYFHSIRHDFVTINICLKSSGLNYYAENESVHSRHANPIFTPPPNA
jgi:hypothetical protein